MKKILCLLLVLVLAIGLCSCGDEFSGNFSKEATEAEAQAVVSEIEEKNAALADDESDATDFDWDGVEVSTKIEMQRTKDSKTDTSAVTVSGKMKLKGDNDKALFEIKSTSTENDGEYNMEGKLFIEQTAEETTTYVDINSPYLANQLRNFDATLEGDSLKYKATTDTSFMSMFTSGMDLYGGEAVQMFTELAASTAELADSGIKVYIDNGTSGTKIKFSLSKEFFVATEGDEVESAGESYLIASFDKDMKLIGMKTRIEYTAKDKDVLTNKEVSMKTIVETTVKGFSGDVTLPSTEGYKDAPSLSGLFS